MNTSDLLFQKPEPGKRLLKFRGDTQTFKLSLPRKEKGNAWLRTNIGYADIARKEIVREVNHDEPLLGRDWFDIPMKRLDNQHFKLTLPLCDIGHFKAKCLFLKEGESDPLWPEGKNTVINVEPADTCCANTIYNTFVRQFGPNKSGASIPTPSEKECIKNLDSEGYTVIPPSGTFRDLIKHLDFIIAELGCRILQLLPVHPTPTTYARMGRFGSPFASLSFTAVDSAQAEFDPRATPLEQFIELVDAVHERHAKVFIDIAINHTGWGARLHETHPEWLVRNPEGQIEVPGAWGVRWEDLTSLDYTHRKLWQYMADMFLKWCRRGVDGFRCDAGYMIPVAAWKYIVTTVRTQFPDTVFFLEGLGGSISVTREILDAGNFNWAYSELFQNYDRSRIAAYLPEAMEISRSEGITVHFAETHDNIRLAVRSRTFAQMRTAMCALFSHNGAFGFANGVEWFATEKIDVHNAPSLNWDAQINQINHIRRLNTLLKVHPAFHDRTEMKLVQQGDGNHVSMLRHHIPSGKKLLILVNLDDENRTVAGWNLEQTGMAGPVFIDLITEEKITVSDRNKGSAILLDPGQVLCLSADPKDIEQVRNANPKAFSLPDRIERQCLRAKVLDVFRFYHNVMDLGKFDPDHAAQQLAEDPVEFCRSLNPFSREPRVVTWKWRCDIKREVMVPPNHFLLVCADVSFRARIVDKDRTVGHEVSLSKSDGSFFALFSPLAPPKGHRSYTLKLSVYTPGRCEHVDAPLLFLSPAEEAKVKKRFHHSELLHQPLVFLGTNGRGSMLRASVSWGKLQSRYDALLGANLNSEFPEDRWIMFSRCRAWLVFQGYSQEIRLDCLDSFHLEENGRGVWRYRIPTGQGEHVPLSIGVEMTPGQNAVQLTFHRHPVKEKERNLADCKQVSLILRPDIEDRSFHDTTKAYMGPEDLWPASVTAQKTGFVFAPKQNRTLDVQISHGVFEWKPEWNYMVYRSIEAERGLDPDSDLFSPGYFSAFLKGGNSLELTAQILNEQEQKDLPPPPAKMYIEKVSAFEENRECRSLNRALRQAIDHYVVKRKPLKTIIAGYPWFLDWGRDSMIFVRGLIAAGRTKDARSVLKQFGQLEKNGTLPNIILGKDEGNRDTSDASLWFFTACVDLVNVEGNDNFLDTPCGSRSIRQILISIGRSLMAGTPNGIRMDPESGLIFSPSHFTWMDTNHPAGTPREGYPIEIQALWYYALSFLCRIDPGKTGNDWRNTAKKVQVSILDLFMLKEKAYRSDCLHARSGETARHAAADDALRPNQLFAITLGAVTDKRICRNMLSACEELLVPGAIRSIADRPVSHPITIVHEGKVLNDPYHPYHGKYKGNEDTGRKPAYHNGTAWTWLFPVFCEAWSKVYGKKGNQTALAWLSSSTRLISTGCIGHVPEILDGDFPHTQRGCDAQAWGTSELLRVRLGLKN
ncbi:MAG: glycogen debranching enzyme N-terminal domain-containing protein [Deltaproteobacteria bacterium]|nr:glycogen debranching enzyme N-terminal domain-containing protein [Deltaproteobacteria bacterium]